MFDTGVEWILVGDCDILTELLSPHKSPHKYPLHTSVHSTPVSTPHKSPHKYPLHTGVNHCDILAELLIKRACVGDRGFETIECY